MLVLSTRSEVYKVFLKIKKNKALSSTIATTAMVANDGKMREEERQLSDFL